MVLRVVNVPPVRQPAKGDVPNDVDDPQDRHEEGGVLVAKPGIQAVRHQVDKGQAAATSQQQEGHGQAQEFWHQQEAILLASQETGSEAGSPFSGLWDGLS